jgi:RNA polymerase sigma-70 factor (ECF subfamily)
LPTDEELMQAVATGDADALRELTARWQRPLYAFLHRTAGGRDTDDLYQETWLRVVRAARAFDVRQRFSTWLFQIALNLSRDLHRRGGPEPASPEDLERATMADRTVTPSQEDARDAALDVQRLLAALPEVQREVVVLRVLEDVPEDEVAQIVGCPRGTVKSRLHHGLARLAELARAGGGS